MALTTIGFASIIAQLLLLREIINISGGNELTYGICLMVWLISTGIGSLIAAGILKKRSTTNAIIINCLFASLSLPIELIIARISPLLLHIPTGTLPSLNSIIFIALLSIAPICMIFGSLFVIGSRQLSDIGKMYVIEGVGSFLGGILFTFIFISLFSPFQIAGLTGTLLTLSSLYIYKHHVKPGKGPNKNWLFVFAFVLAVNSTLIHPLGAKADRSSARWQWSGLELIGSTDSIHGRISVIANNGALSYFENGNLAFSTASVAENEEAAHLAMLQAYKAKNILVIGGGSGPISEIKKHKPHSVEYIEFDPTLANISDSHPTYIGDGRLFLRNTPARYDLIMLNIGDPKNASIARFYTKEFFSLCLNKLTENGVLAFKLSGSADYMGKEIRELNTSIYKTLNMVFNDVKMIPASGIYYFASPSKNILTDDPITLTKRWSGQNVATRYFNSRSIPHMLSLDKTIYVNNAIAYDEKTPANSDMRPISYSHAIMTWLSYYQGGIGSLFRSVISIPITTFILMIALFSIYFIYLSKRNIVVLMPSVIFLVGASAMSAQLLYIYVYQALYGDVYRNIGILIALFMGSLSAGGYFAVRNKKNITFPVLILPMIISVLLLMLFTFVYQNVNLAFSQYIIYSLTSLTAFFTGTIFPAAADRYRSDDLNEKAGVLYGIDLLGGAIAALFSSLLFIPVYGILGTCAVVLALYVSALFLSFAR